MRPRAGERLLLANRQHLLKECTKSDTYCRSCSHSLDIGRAVLSIRFHHALARPVQRCVR